MDKAFHRRFLQTQRFCELGVGNIFSLSGKTAIQHIKNAPATTFFAFIPQSPQRTLDHCGRPAYIEDSFWGPILRFLFWNRQVRWCLSHPIVPRNELHVSATFPSVTFVHGDWW